MNSPGVLAGRLGLGKAWSSFRAGCRRRGSCHLRHLVGQSSQAVLGVLALLFFHVVFGISPFIPRSAGRVFCISPRGLLQFDTPPAIATKEMGGTCSVKYLYHRLNLTYTQLKQWARPPALCSPCLFPCIELFAGDGNAPQIYAISRLAEIRSIAYGDKLAPF